MGNREDPGWKRIAEVLQRIARTHEDDRSSVVSAVSGRVSSSSGSAERRPKESGSSDPLERDYVRAVLDCYLWLPGTSSLTSRHDRRCAQQLYRRGVPLEVVRSAMVVAVARRAERLLPPVVLGLRKRENRGVRVEDADRASGSRADDHALGKQPCGGNNAREKTRKSAGSVGAKR